MFEHIVLEGLKRFSENVEAVTNRQRIRAEAKEEKHQATLDYIRGDIDSREYHERKKEINHQKNDDLICSYLDGIQRRLDRW